MKKNFLIGIALGAMSLTSTAVKASEATGTEFKIFGGMDSYYVTDNASLRNDYLINYDNVGFNGQRLFAPNNPYKDMFGINNALLGASAQGSWWKANLELDMYRASEFEVGQANVGIKMCEGFWLEAGYFYTNVPGEYDYYGWDNYFTSYSIAVQQATGKEMGIGLAYSFTDNISANLRVINSGYAGMFDNNRSKSVSARVNFAEIVPDWTLSIGTLIGNEESLYSDEKMMSFSAIDFRGKFNDKLEGAFILQCGTKSDAKLEDNGDVAMAIHFGVTAQVRYHFTEKLNASVRASFSDNKDGGFSEYAGLSAFECGLNLEYRPVSSAYLRLEGGFLSLNAKNEDAAKLFRRDDEWYNSRMQLAFSTGVFFDIYSSLK